MTIQEPLKDIDGQSNRCCKICLKEEQRINVLSKQYFTTKQRKTKGRKKYTKIMKKSIQLVLTTIICSVLLMGKYFRWTSLQLYNRAKLFIKKSLFCLYSKVCHYYKPVTILFCSVSCYFKLVCIISRFTTKLSFIIKMCHTFSVNNIICLLEISVEI